MNGTAAWQDTIDTNKANLKNLIRSSIYYNLLFKP